LWSEDGGTDCHGDTQSLNYSYAAYGHYKFEAIGSLFLSLTLIGTGLSVGAMSHKQLLPFLNPGGVMKVAMEAVPVPGLLALVMAGISIASKEWLYRITKEVGEKLNSVRE
jgi:divalent metal cation (Fe/Co/Zn/Cd) transporter